MNMPQVSAVIPTRNRSDLVQRAVRSALNQTVRDIEVIVVIDGPDEATEISLAKMADKRIKVIALEQSVGGSEARNIGVRAASAAWIAFLDDDDEWMPKKIERQVKVAADTMSPYVLVCSRMIARLPGGEYIWPRRLPESNEHISEYLFCRKGLSFGDGFLQTSSFFSSRSMCIEIPFQKGLQRFQDADWLLRACTHPSVRLQVIEEPLVIYYIGVSANAVSRKPDWEYLYHWALSNRNLFTDRAFAFFLATQCIPRARKQREPFRVFVSILKECIFRGSPTVNCVLSGIVFWFVPEHARHMARDVAASVKRLFGKRTSKRT